MTTSGSVDLLDIQVRRTIRRRGVVVMQAGIPTAASDFAALEKRLGTRPKGYGLYLFASRDSDPQEFLAVTPARVLNQALADARWLKAPATKHDSLACTK